MPAADDTASVSHMASSGHCSVKKAAMQIKVMTNHYKQGGRQNQMTDLAGLLHCPAQNLTAAKAC